MCICRVVVRIIDVIKIPRMMVCSASFIEPTIHCISIYCVKLNYYERGFTHILSCMYPSFQRMSVSNFNHVSPCLHKYFVSYLLLLTLVIYYSNSIYFSFPNFSLNEFPDSVLKPFRHSTCSDAGETTSCVSSAPSVGCA